MLELAPFAKVDVPTESFVKKITFVSPTLERQLPFAIKETIDGRVTLVPVGDCILRMVLLQISEDVAVKAGPIIVGTDAFWSLNPDENNPLLKNSKKS